MSHIHPIETAAAGHGWDKEGQFDVEPLGRSRSDGSRVDK